MIYYVIIYQLSTTEPTNVQNIPGYQQLPCGFELMTLCKFMVFIVLFISITNIVKVLIQVKYFLKLVVRTGFEPVRENYNYRLHYVPTEPCMCLPFHHLTILNYSFNFTKLFNGHINTRLCWCYTIHRITPTI